MNDKVITLIPAKAKEEPTENRPFRVAAYCRVSSPSEEQELSLETQRWYYGNKIENHALWERAGIFADTATGRNLKQRVEFKKLLAKCRIGKVDLVITKSISRFGRNSLETIKALRELRSSAPSTFIAVSCDFIVAEIWWLMKIIDIFNEPC